jgi:hypothetical protein
MASSVVKTTQLTRGRAANLGAITSGQVVQFTLPQEDNSPNGLECLTIVVVGGTIATPGLEASIDGATTWFGVAARAAVGTAPNYNLTTLNSDTAATAANSYDVSSLQAGAVFRFGGATAPATVWALFS